MNYIQHNPEDDSNIHIPETKTEVRSYEYVDPSTNDKYRFEWNDHMKVWCAELGEFLYHGDDRLVPKEFHYDYNIEDRKVSDERRYRRDQYARVYSKTCGCFSGHSTSDTYGRHPGCMISYSNEKKENVERYDEFRLYHITPNSKTRVDKGILKRNTYRTSIDNDSFSLIKFFNWRNDTYFLLNEEYGKIGVYNIVVDENKNVTLDKYMQFVTGCFNEEVFLVDNGTKFVMHHWVWNPMNGYRYYDIDKFMTEHKGHDSKSSPYEGQTLYPLNPYGDGMDFFKINDGEDHFYYYFNVKYWWYAKSRKWMLNKFGANSNNTVIRITYKDLDEMFAVGIRFPWCDANALCGCGANRFIEECDPSNPTDTCEWRKEHTLVDCPHCHTKCFKDKMCECQDEQYERDLDTTSENK